MQLPRVLPTANMLMEKGTDTVATAFVAVAIPAFDTTTVAVKLAPAWIEFDDSVDVIDRSTVEAAVKFAVWFPLVMFSAAEGGVNTRFGYVGINVTLPEAGMLKNEYFPSGAVVAVPRAPPERETPETGWLRVSTTAPLIAFCVR